MSTERDLEDYEDIQANIEDKFRDSYDTTLANTLKNNPIEIPLYLLAAVFFFYHIWYGFTVPFPRDQHGIIHLGFVLAIWGVVRLVAVDRSTRGGKVRAIAYSTYVILAAFPLYYLHSNYDQLQITAGVYTDMEILIGGLIILFLLIALWSVSKLIFIIAVLGLLYPYMGPYLPGILNHGGLSIERIVTMNTVEFQGVFGELLRVAATWVAIFIILAGIIEKYNGMAMFIEGTTRIASRHDRFEIGQLAVLSSMIFGSINGASTANAATTGAFTIPLMKENNYPPRLAGGIEAVASCGGQVLPPVMGTAVFIMAELITPSYGEIVIAAAIPAFLFFFTIAISIELYSRQFESEKMPRALEERSIVQRIFSVCSNYEYIAMLIILLYYLVYIQADPLLAGAYSIAVLIIFRFVKTVEKLYRRSGKLSSARSSMRLFSRESIEGFRRGATMVANITIMVASLGIIVRAFIVTGLAQSLSNYLISIGGASIVLITLLAAISSIVFGMGMPTVAAYLLVALFVAPPLSQILPVGELEVHMFVFYFAVVSSITPPIAVNVVITQGIAGSGFIETSIDTLKMGFPLFLLPFMFIFNNEILNPGIYSLLIIIVIAVGFAGISVALIGYAELSLFGRAIFGTLGFIVLFGSNIYAQALIAVIIIGGLAYYSERFEVRSLLQNGTTRLGLR